MSKYEVIIPERRYEIEISEGWIQCTNPECFDSYPNTSEDNPAGHWHPPQEVEE